MDLKNMRNDTLLQTAIMSANCIIWGMRSQFKNHMDRLNNAIVEMESRGMDNDLNILTKEISNILTSVPNEDKNNLVNRDHVTSLAYVHLDLIDPVL